MPRKIIYEPHPVSAERKAELRAQGYSIIDARFAPADAAPVEPVAEVVAEPVEEAKPEAKKRGRPTKVAADAEISDKAEAPSEE